ncbi:dTDP-4-dehydrorhamnose 3,5-epimerase [Arsukibacterium sp. MJ3]|uniref:dTDP-4-dehydrorhamnose 3,5-epimerase n=1 Tax=Arsukibacterium sp. MJ3 TaxID=1632859 RepID=UPI0006273180|nr:dTDP-4-dehydrorhamnose 3,5-epimerase [Arsukibacterium sp. MJ3]KKO47875.1 dTDP-4-dehydrorhamnose 3,5-epimerase [Arsukibacterium sp. MJ3]
MKVIDTAIPDVKIIEPAVFSDERGWFMESWNHKVFCELIADREFVQDNQSISHKGVLRGLHYQVSPFQQGKLVRVVTGSVFDVAVDIRENSDTYGKYVAVELSAKNRKMLWIPEGFAHGFLSLEDNTTFLYKTTGYYSKDSERSINWMSSSLNIAWPNLEEVIVNEKDSSATLFKFNKLHT